MPTALPGRNAGSSVKTVLIRECVDIKNRRPVVLPQPGHVFKKNALDLFANSMNALENDGVPDSSVSVEPNNEQENWNSEPPTKA